MLDTVRWRPTTTIRTRPTGSKRCCDDGVAGAKVPPYAAHVMGSLVLRTRVLSGIVITASALSCNAITGIGDLELGAGGAGGSSNAATSGTQAEHSGATTSADATSATTGSGAASSTGA